MLSTAESSPCHGSPTIPLSKYKTLFGLGDLYSTHTIFSLLTLQYPGETVQIPLSHLEGFIIIIFWANCAHTLIAVWVSVLQMEAAGTNRLTTMDAEETMRVVRVPQGVYTILEWVNHTFTLYIPTQKIPSFSKYKPFLYLCTVYYKNVYICAYVILYCILTVFNIYNNTALCYIVTVCMVTALYCTLCEYISWQRQRFRYAHTYFLSSIYIPYILNNSEKGNLPLRSCYYTCHRWEQSTGHSHARRTLDPPPPRSRCR